MKNLHFKVSNGFDEFNIVYEPNVHVDHPFAILATRDENAEYTHWSREQLKGLKNLLTLVLDKTDE